MLPERKDAGARRCAVQPKAPRKWCRRRLAAVVLAAPGGASDHALLGVRLHCHLTTLAQKRTHLSPFTKDDRGQGSTVKCLIF